MIPASVYELRSLEAILEERDALPPEGSVYKCSGCPRILAPSGFVSTAGLPGDLPAFLCHTCASGPHRLAVAAQAEEERAAATAAGEHDWSAVRGERDIRLARCDWTQGGDSPLDDDAKAAWAAYRQELRDITSTAPDPDSVVWPPAPS